MKKLLCLILSLVLLTACGSENELDKFVESYNRIVSGDDVPKLVPEEFGVIEQEENMSWQQLYESENYSIDAKYEDGESLSGYYLVIDENEPLEEYEGEGYRAGISIAKALGLNAGDYVRGFGTALEEGSHSYTEEGYRITFSYSGASGLTSVGMIINYDKQ